MKLNHEQIRNIVFGVEDSIVSTTGVLFGIASVQGYNFKQIAIVGLVLVAVEAISMGVGSFLSETSAQEVEKYKNQTPFLDGILMFFSYFMTGVIIVMPYIILNSNNARYYSAALAFLLLGLLGYMPQRKLKSALRMLFLGGMALIAGYTIANYLNLNL